MTTTIVPLGAFSLAEAVGFGFEQRDAADFDGSMRLAFVVDGYDTAAGVLVTQDEVGVHLAIESSAPVTVVRDQVARILSLDVDARGFEAVGERDPVVARLLAAAPGLRPPLFPSPYEAAVWGVIGQRISSATASVIRDRIAVEHGTRFVVGGKEKYAFPLPSRLVGIDTVRGLPEVKVARLQGIAQAALDGRLDVAELRELPGDEAQARLRELPGIGPFYASLIRLRATGVTDDLVTGEPRSAAIIGQLWGIDGADRTAVERVAEAWQPFRTWVAVLCRAAAGRLDQA